MSGNPHGYRSTDLGRLVSVYLAMLYLGVFGASEVIHSILGMRNRDCAEMHRDVAVSFAKGSISSIVKLRCHYLLDNAVHGNFGQRLRLT